MHWGELRYFSEFPSDLFMNQIILGPIDLLVQVA
jgi:hypothetical protein